MLANLNNVFLTEEETAKQPNTISFTKSTAAATNSVQQIQETPLPYFKSILNENWYDSPFDPSLTKSDFSSIISNPFDAGFALENPYLLPSHSFNSTGFDSFENSLYLNRPKILKPLETFPCIGAQPTLFQKRAAEKIGRNNDSNSSLNCDAEDFCISENVNGTKASIGGNCSNSGDYKGRKKSVLPAKNLMAERRRRKKLNDRLYMLRSVVPKISKMDRASILGDAIEYLKELLQRINGLHDELESINSPLPTSSTSNFQPLTPTPALPCRITEEVSSSRSLLSPNGQEPRVEVRLREGRAVNIHMFCARRPGLLLSTMRALDDLGLDIQQAVISCFNGFALDVFRAEQPNNGPDVLPEEIKEVLLQSAGFQSTV